MAEQNSPADMQVQEIKTLWGSEGMERGFFVYTMGCISGNNPLPFLRDIQGSEIFDSRTTDPSLFLDDRVDVLGLSTLQNVDGFSAPKRIAYSISASPRRGSPIPNTQVYEACVMAKSKAVAMKLAAMVVDVFDRHQYVYPTKKPKPKRLDEEAGYSVVAGVEHKPRNLKEKIGAVPGDGTQSLDLSQ